MEKVRPWCGQPSDRGRLKIRSDQSKCRTCRSRRAVSSSASRRFAASSASRAAASSAAAARASLCRVSSPHRAASRSARTCRSPSWPVSRATSRSRSATAVCTTATHTCIQCESKHKTLYSWLGSRVVSALDSGAVGPGSISQSRRCRVTVLGKLFTPIVPQ